MTTPITPKKFVNSVTAMGTTWLLMPKNVSSELKDLAIVGAVATVLNVPDSQQDNIRVLNSLAYGVAIVSNHPPVDTSAQNLFLATALASTTIFFAQLLFEEALTPNQTERPSTLPALDGIYDIFTRGFWQSGPQTVAQTARRQGQRENVGSRA